MQEKTKEISSRKEVKRLKEERCGKVKRKSGERYIYLNGNISITNVSFTFPWPSDDNESFSFSNTLYLLPLSPFVIN